MRYVEKKGLPLVGFREVDRRFLCDSKQCEVLHPSLGHKISAAREMLDNISIKNKVAQIEVSITDESKVLIFRNLETFSENDLNVLRDFAKENDFVIYCQPGKQKSIHGLNGGPLENQFYRIDDFDLTMHFSPIDFTQVNFDINQMMVKRAIELLQLTAQDEVLDLFCGLGNFSLAIAHFAKSVVGVEGSDVMTQRASENAASNNITNTHYIISDLCQDFKSANFAKQYDKLLIDPPRSGAMNIVENIEVFNPQRIVYVSCNPATLARDINVLVNSKNYSLENIGVMDMFPHTSHVESITVLSRT